MKKTTLKKEDIERELQDLRNSHETDEEEEEDDGLHRPNHVIDIEDDDDAEEDELENLADTSGLLDPKISDRQKHKSKKQQQQQQKLIQYQQNRILFVLFILLCIGIVIVFLAFFILWPREGNSNPPVWTETTSVPILRTWIPWTQCFTLTQEPDTACLKTFLFSNQSSFLSFSLQNQHTSRLYLNHFGIEKIDQQGNVVKQICSKNVQSNTLDSNLKQTLLIHWPNKEFENNKIVAQYLSNVPLYSNLFEQSCLEENISMNNYFNNTLDLYFQIPSWIIDPSLGTKDEDAHHILKPIRIESLDAIFEKGSYIVSCSTPNDKHLQSPILQQILFYVDEKTNKIEVFPTKIYEALKKTVQKTCKTDEILIA